VEYLTIRFTSLDAQRAAKTALAAVSAEFCGTGSRCAGQRLEGGAQAPGWSRSDVPRQDGNGGDRQIARQARCLRWLHSSMSYDNRIAAVCYRDRQRSSETAKARSDPKGTNTLLENLIAEESFRARRF
jgi:hypothetical protein